MCIDNNFVLISFAGNSDPTRNGYDGPILHICRKYKPSKIYLILTKEMQERDKEPYNIYEKSLKENLKGYEPTIIRIPTDIVEAHKFDSYNRLIYEAFEQIKNENDEIKILVNITSGTPQMITTLVSYIVDSVDCRIIPIQVETPEKSANKSKVVNNDYDVEYEAFSNIDNEEYIDRTISPDLTYFSRILLKNQIKKVLDKYDYEMAIELLRKNSFSNDREINTLLNYAKDRKNLVGVESNKKIRALNTKKYDQFYYYSKDEKIKKIPTWYKVIDYFSLAITKVKGNDISGYTLMMEPIVVNLYKMILEDIINKPLDSLFDRVNNKFCYDYKINLKKLDLDMKKYIEKKLNINSLQDSTHISDRVLSSIILYYLEQKNVDTLNITEFEKFKKQLENIKNLRNTLAHNLRNISRQEFEIETGQNIDKINADIKKYCEKCIKNTTTCKYYKESMLYIYDDMNAVIIKLLENQI